MKTDYPYPSRPYPVGPPEYLLTPERAEKVTDLKGKHASMLECGEPEVMFDMPRIVGLGGNYFNLGHAMGGSALLLARGLQDQGMVGFIYSVDTFEYFKNHWERANEELDRKNQRTCITLCRGTTTKWAKVFAENNHLASFVFIDADHSYQGVYNDWMDYSPLVVSGGVVAFHDTNQEPSHRVIVENVLPSRSWEQILHINRIKAFRRV